MFKKPEPGTVSEPPKLKPYFYEDWKCAVLYFKENLARIRAILELEKNLRKNAKNNLVCRLLLEFSVVLLVSAFEGYCYEKIREVTRDREDLKAILKRERYEFQNPAHCNKAFREVVGIEVLKVQDKGKPEDQDKLRRMKIFSKKRHCIIHRNSKVDSKLRDMLNQKIAIDAEIPLDDLEIKRVMGIMREFVLKVESSCPSPVNWGKEGLML